MGLELTSSPGALYFGIGVLLSSEMSLHIIIKVRHRLVNKFIVSYSTVLSFFNMLKPLSRSADNNTAVGSWNEIIIIASIEADAIGVDQMRRVGSFGAANMAGNAPNRHDAPGVFG